MARQKMSKYRVRDVRPAATGGALGLLDLDAEPLLLARPALLEEKGGLAAPLPVNQLSTRGQSSAEKEGSRQGIRAR